MAKIKLGSLAQDARGSIAGVTFTRNRYGAVARQKVSGVQPRTVRQLDQRAIFTAASQAWRSLTPDQQAAWAAYAASHPFSDVFGDSQVLAANALFTGVQSDLSTLGLDATVSPPADPTTTPTPALSAVADSGAGTITITTAAQVVDTGFYEVFATPALSPGAQFAGSKLRLVGVQATVAAAVSVVATPGTFGATVGIIAGYTTVVFVRRFDVQGVRQDLTRFNVIAG
jgi:hypothetical protein